MAAGGAACGVQPPAPIASIASTWRRSSGSTPSPHWIPARGPRWTSSGTTNQSIRQIASSMLHPTIGRRALAQELPVSMEGSTGTATTGLPRVNLDTGFPVDINTAKTESLTVAKDSTGRLWATWVQNQQVMVNHTLNGNDASWGTPFVLPVGSSANVSSDDLSAITTFDGDKIAVMWSQQSGSLRMYVATHADGAPDGSWQAVAAYTTSGDDHINIKSLSDSAGQLFAVVKTSNSAANTGLIVVLVCRNTASNCTQASDWSSYPVYDSDGGTFDATRAILLIDRTNRKLYVFASLSYSGDRAIFYKITDLDNIQFAPGRGELFIFEDGSDTNNPSSTKQILDGTTDLVVLASAADSNRYYHNWINLASLPDPRSMLRRFLTTTAAW